MVVPEGVGEASVDGLGGENGRRARAVEMLNRGISSRTTPARRLFYYNLAPPPTRGLGGPKKKSDFPLDFARAVAQDDAVVREELCL